MKKTAVLMFFISFFVASSVMAEEPVEQGTTYYLYGACMDVIYQNDTLTTSVYCKSFIQGTVQTYKYYASYYNFPNQYCLPKGISEREIVKILIKLVDEQPIFFEKPALTTIHYALKNAFPCSEF